MKISGVIVQKVGTRVVQTLKSHIVEQRDSMVKIT